jgi:hypothetical protein
MAKKNPSVTSLRAGQTVYYVHALGEQSFMGEHVVTGHPYFYKSIGSWFCPAKHLLRYKSHVEALWIHDEFSLRDCNCDEQNGYNSHRLFYSKKKALRYLKTCLATPDKYEFHPTRLIPSDDSDDFSDDFYDGYKDDFKEKNDHHEGFILNPKTVYAS